MATPYIPARDADFDAWLLNFGFLLAAAPITYGLTAPDVVPLTAAIAAWTPAYAAATTPATRTSATVATKDGARATAEFIGRPLAIAVRNDSGVSDALKIGLGLTIPNVPPTPIPAPTVAPALSLVSATSLDQRLAYRVPGALGKAKPFGAIGVEIWRSVGTAFAVDPDQTAYIGSVTKSPFRQSFGALDQGKKVTYYARYVTRSGPAGMSQPGPWSDPLTLVVM